MSETSCKNCDETLPPGSGFCPACGQSVKTVSRPWLEFARETLLELADFDGRMLISLRLLLTRPGFLSLEYISGRRVAYTSPIRIYLVISLAFFFLLPLIMPTFEVENADHKFSADLYSKGMFFLLPFFALLLKLFYRKLFYIDHLVFAVYLFSAMFIALAPLLATEGLADRYMAVILVQLVFLLYMVGYVVIAFHTNYQESWTKSVLKCFAVVFLFLPALGLTIELASHVE